MQFPTYASSNTALSALQTDQLHWAGNFIPGVQQVFVNGHSNHHVWFTPIQTNSLMPNLTKFPTNQLAVRKAISLAIDRTALSEQAEALLNGDLDAMRAIRAVRELNWERDDPIRRCRGLSFRVRQQLRD